MRIIFARGHFTPADVLSRNVNLSAHQNFYPYGMPQDQLDYSFRTTANPRCTVLTLQGALTLAHIFALQPQLQAVDADLFLIDCTALQYMDSAGLGVLVNFYVSQSDKGRKVALVGISDRVWALFQSTRVDQFFPRFATVEEAESAL